MNKDEILRQAQSKKPNTPDEMELQVIRKGSGIALFSILVLCLIFMLVKIAVKQPWYDVYSICFISMGVQHLYKGIQLHQKHEQILGIICSIVALIMAAAYICELVM